MDQEQIINELNSDILLCSRVAGNLQEVCDELSCQAVGELDSSIRRMYVGIITETSAIGNELRA